MSDRVTLEQVFGAFVNQGTLEDAASLMADLSASYPELAAEFASMLQNAIDCSESDEASVIAAVHRSGYRVVDASEAKTYCAELLSLIQGSLGGQP